VLTIVRFDDDVAFVDDVAAGVVVDVMQHLVLDDHLKFVRNLPNLVVVI
jgi:hypothetical protein